MGLGSDQPAGHCRFTIDTLIRKGYSFSAGSVRGSPQA